MTKSPTSLPTSSSRSALAITIIWLGAAAVLGMFNSFRPTILSGFTQVQVEPVDSRFNHYILEHTFRCVHQADYIGSLWSPPFFFPARNVLAYSDNLLGSAPIYWLMRLCSGPRVAFSLWMIICCLLCFATFAALLRRLQIQPALVATGPLLFAFGLHRSRIIGHQQMLPQFFTPLALWAVYELVNRPRRRWFLVLLCCIYLQTLCGIYLGWMLAFSLLFFVPFLLILQRPSQRLVFEFVRHRWLSIAALMMLFAAGSWFTFGPYFRTPGTGGYAWEETQKYLPPLAWYFPPWRTSDPLNGIGVADVSPEVHPLLPMNGFIFFTSGIFALVLMVAGKRRKTPSPSGEDRTVSLALAAFITAAALVLVSARLPNNTTLWWLVYRFMPGGAGIRAVSRLDLTVDFYAILFVVIGIDHSLKRVACRRRRMIVASSVAILLIAEQWVAGLSSFDARPLEQKTTALATLMRNGGDAAYVANDKPQDWSYSAALQVSAMWAGLDANKPVVNGYSGRSPPGYPGILRLFEPDDMADWFSRTNVKMPALTLIAPTPPGMPENWIGQIPKDSLTKSDHFTAGVAKGR